MTSLTFTTTRTSRSLVSYDPTFNQPTSTLTRNGYTTNSYTVERRFSKLIGTRDSSDNR